MKKLDKLVLGSFIGPFILTFLVVVFILLMQHMLKYFDDIIGKGLTWDVIGQLLFHFAVFMTPVALPLAVLLSSLIAFGNLGEHFELTAIKGAGISLLRALRPIFVFVLLLTGVAFYANNYLVPEAALEAYSLLYDIKQKKPALELREGAFYYGIPDVSIKVDKKFPEDDAALKDIIVYDHSRNSGNKDVIIADSGRMTTILNERYLKFELFNGYNYTEDFSREREMMGGKRSSSNESLTRSRFTRSEVVFDLSSYQLTRTDKKWFEGNRIMRNLAELNGDIDSLESQVLQQRLNYHLVTPTFFRYYFRGDSLAMPKEVYEYKLRRDSINLLRRMEKENRQAPDKKIEKQGEKREESQFIRVAMRQKQTPQEKPAKKSDTKKTTPRKDASRKRSITKEDTQRAIDSVFNMEPRRDVIDGAANNARQVKSQIDNGIGAVDSYTKELAVFKVQWHKIVASSMACIAMFLIGAPLGAIIKRGGLGVPFLVSIFFFIIYYVITMQGEKFAKQEMVDAWIGVWAADIILFLIGLVFLRQARADARLFEADFYRVVFDKVKRWMQRRRGRAANAFS